VKKSSLDAFGSLLMKRVRDQVIFEWNGYIDGQMKGSTAARIQESLHLFDTRQIAALHQLIPEIVDTTLHHLLWMIEQEKAVNLTLSDKDGEVHELRDLSDGLAGELYAEDGWIARFSKNPKSK